MVNLDVAAVESLWDEISGQLIPVVQKYRGKVDTLHVERKADSTLLTEADTHVQDLIVSTIRAFDPKSYIVAEEVLASTINSDVDENGIAWIIDPIDGTSQFMTSDSREFCTAVALTVNGAPRAALVLGYELGVAGTAIQVTADLLHSKVRLDGRELTGNDLVAQPSGWASMTRSAGSKMSPIEAAAMQAGLKVKTRTTSQTVDLLRTTPASYFLHPRRHFEVFYRENQKVWDGIPGICLAASFGLAVQSLHPGNPFIPLEPDFLRRPEPIFRSTLVGSRSRVDSLTAFEHAVKP